MSDDLVEEVARAICFSRNAPTCSCTKETGCLSSVMVRVEATQARAALRAVAEWLDEHEFYPERLCATLLKKQLEANG